MSQPLTKDLSSTPGPWEWWTSNSWRRLKRSVRGTTQNVLEPYTCRDGQADLVVNEADMALIAAAPDLLEWAEKVLAAYMPQFNDSRAVDDVLVGLAAAVTKATTHE